VEKGALLVVPRLLQVLVIVMNSSQSTRQPFVDGQRLGANSAGARVVRASPPRLLPTIGVICMLVNTPDDIKQEHITGSARAGGGWTT
jgi:hypothetical protein